MIKSLIFDFGDIFINLDKEATLNNLKTLGLKAPTPNMILVNKLYEIGRISTHTFVNYYQDLFPKTKADELIAIWNSILLDFPKHRLEFIKALSKSKKYQLILLSNTNELHIDWVKANIPFYNEFKNCFDAFYLSHEIYFRKPDSSIFNFVLNNHALKASECFFIDDTKENTDGASLLGIHTWNLNPEKDDITQLFDRYKHLA